MTTSPVNYNVRSTLFKEFDQGAFGKRLFVHLNPSETGAQSTFAPFINHNEEVYLDCSKKKILLKHVVLLVARPFHGLIKWLAIPVEIGIDVYEGKFKKNILRRVANIVTIPLYTLAMEVFYVAGIILSPFHADILYKTRELSGKLELLMYHASSFDDPQTKELIGLLAPCFTPIFKLSHLDYMQDKQDNIESFFIHHRNFLNGHCDTYNWCQSQSATENYISPFLKKSVENDTLPTEPWTSTCREEDPYEINDFINKEKLTEIHNEHPTWNWLQVAAEAKISLYTYSRIMHSPQETSSL